MQYQYFCLKIRNFRLLKTKKKTRFFLSFARGNHCRYHGLAARHIYSRIGMATYRPRHIAFEIDFTVSGIRESAHITGAQWSDIYYYNLKVENRDDKNSFLTTYYIHYYHDICNRFLPRWKQKSLKRLSMCDNNVITNNNCYLHFP